MAGESFICLFKGDLEVRLLSPVFSQNMYQGVYEDLASADIPEWINLFEIDEERFPLLKEVEDYILTVKLRSGDCLYVP